MTVYVYMNVNGHGDRSIRCLGARVRGGYELPSMCGMDPEIPRGAVLTLNLIC